MNRTTAQVFEAFTKEIPGVMAFLSPDSASGVRALRVLLERSYYRRGKDGATHSRIKAFIEFKNFHSDLWFEWCSPIGDLHRAFKEQLYIQALISAYGSDSLEVKDIREGRRVYYMMLGSSLTERYTKFLPDHITSLRLSLRYSEGYLVTELESQYNPSQHILFEESLWTPCDLDHLKEPILLEGLAKAVGLPFDSCLLTRALTWGRSDRSR